MKAVLVLLCVVGCASAQNFAGTSSGDVFILPPNRLCVGADNGGQACLIQGGPNMAKLLNSGLSLGSFTAASLPSAPNGSIVYCADCVTQNPCAGAGNGAIATRISGAWNCSAGGGGGGNIDPGNVNTQVAKWSVSGNKYTPQTKPVYDARDWGLVCDGATNDTAATSALLTAIGSTQAVIKIPFTQPCLMGSVSFPANVTLDFGNGGAIKNVIDNTAPGGATFVQGAGQVNAAGTASNSCSVSLTGTAAGNTIVMMVEHAFTGATEAGPSDGTNFYVPLLQQGFNFSTVVASYAASSIAGGNVTVTAPLSAVVQNACFAWEFHGAGISVGLDAGLASTEGGVPLTMSSGPITTTTGALLIGYGGNRRYDETCTAGAGYTIPAGTAGSVGGINQGGPTDFGESFCAEYRLASPGGAQTPSMTITQDPGTPGGSNRYWAFSSIALIPKSAFIQVLGGIINDNLHQIFYNALPGQGTVDFTGNLAIQRVYPEWWGASSTASAATNTPAIQASIYGAYGQNRINGGGNTQYNKELHFSQGTYNINDELKFYHTIGFKVTGECRLCTAINQTTVNKRIIDGQSNAYGEFASMGFTATASQDLSHPLVDLDYNAVQGSDLAPQFINFHDVNWNGGGVAKTGFQLSKSGGAAQGSNVYFYDNLAAAFTEACYMIGAGSGGVPTSTATNAIAITWFGGDIQGCPAYGIENFGGQQLKLDGTTFENGFTTQTGFDVLCANLPAGGACEIDNVRSESRRLAAGSKMVIKHSYLQDQTTTINPGFNLSVGTIIQGSFAGGDGKYYKITVQGVASGVGTQTVPIIATSGSGTTLVNTNDTVTGSVTIGTPIKLETMTQAVTGSTGTLLNVPASTGTITGSVTSGTIGSGHTMTQATTGVTCTSTNAPTGTTSLTCNNFSGTADNSHIWTDGTTSGTYTPTAAPTFSVASPAMVITAATGSPDNTHNWTGGTSSAVYVPTSAPTPANYTVNAWTGWQVTTIGGTANSQYCVVTSNTADTFTCSGGWLTNFSNVTIANPDNTTTFIVEPNWGTQTTSGGATWALDTENGLEGSQGGQLYLIAEDDFFPGLRANLDVGRSQLRNVKFTRSDWLTNAGSTLELGNTSARFDNVFAATQNNSNMQYRTWGFPRNGITGLKDFTFDQHLMQPLCWLGGSSTSVATVDICLKPVPNSGTKNGSLNLLNNSSGTTKTWNYNADGTTTFPAAVTAPSYTASGSNGGLSATEGTGASVPAGAGLDVLWPDSTAHRWKMNNNNEATSENVAGTLPSGNVTTAGTAVTNGTCQAQTGITVTGALTTDNVVANIGAALPATWQTGIQLSAHVTGSNTVTVYLCNPTAGSITPAATQVNVRIVR